MSDRVRPGDPQPLHRPVVILRWREAIAKASKAARDFERSMDAVTRAADTTPAEVADRWQRVLDRARKSV